MSNFLTNSPNEVHVIKHTAMVHIGNQLTLLARKVSNVLLKNAYNTLDKEVYHRMKITDLMEAVGLEKSNNMELVKRPLRELAYTHIEWNIFDKNKCREWNIKKHGITHMLSYVGWNVVAGYCEYSYHDSLKGFFRNPNIYAKLDLLTQKNFKNKHAIVLWEFLSEIICTSKYPKNIISTEYFDIKKIKQMFSLKKGMYETFMEFNRSVLQKAITEINKVSDIETKIFYKKELRKVVAVRFEIQKRTSTQKPIQDFLIKEQEMIDNPLQTTLQDNYKISKTIAKRLVNTTPAEQIQVNLEYVDEYKKTKKVDNLGSFTKKAIVEDWQLKTTEEEKKTAEENKVRMAKFKAQDELKNKIANHKEDYSDYCKKIGFEMYNNLTNDDKISTVEKIVLENSYFNKMSAEITYKASSHEAYLLAEYTLKNKNIDLYQDFLKDGGFDIRQAKKDLEELQ